MDGRSRLAVVDLVPEFSTTVVRYEWNLGEILYGRASVGIGDERSAAVAG